MDEKNRDRMVDQSSEVVDVGSESLLDQSMSSSVLDVSHSAGIRSSRRRLKGSAVVMNTDRLAKYIHKEAVEESSDDPFRAQMLGFKEKYKQKMTLKLEADAKMDALRRKIFAKMLVRWWKKYLLNRQLNFCQGGVWSFHVAHRVFAVLLGFRVRKLMRSTKVMQNISGQKDIQNVLSEMHCSMLGNSVGSTTITSWELFRIELEQHSVDDLLLKYPGTKLTDLTLAKSMCKQLFVERHNLSRLILGGAVWRQFPPPGYWDIAASLHKASVVAQEKENRAAINSSSPARRVPSQKGNMETPPNVRRAVKNSSSNAKVLSGEVPLRNKNNSHLISGSEEYVVPGGSDSKLLSSEDGAVNRLRHSNERQERVIEPRLLRTPETVIASRGWDGLRASEQIPGVSSTEGGSGGSKPIRRPDTAPCAGSTPVGMNINSNCNNNNSATGTSPQAQRQRASQRGHIQLHILSGERLMPARKGAPLRDSNGFAVADRIPCLKVKLMLPNWSTGVGRNQSSPETANNTMKRVFEQTKDFNVVTLNPQWDATFILNLPCPRSVVQSLAMHEAADAYSPGHELTDRAYDIITRALLQWWSLGIINIEVFDGERFNQDIFMGYIDLILNGFMVLIKKPNDLEIKGNFQLNKQKPTDRISGSVKLHAFLHVPEKAYIAELLEPTATRGSQSNLPPPQSHRQSPSSIGKSIPVLRDGNNSSDLDESDDYVLKSRSHQHKSVSGAVYSSKFMQSLAKQALRSSSPLNERHEDGDEKSFTPLDVQSSFLNAPQLDETENIRFNSQTGQAASQQNISASARLLKEKLRKSKTVRKPAGRNATPPTLPEDDLFQGFTHPDVEKERHSARNAAPSVSMGLRNSTTATAKALKEQSVDSSHVRRRSMEDINQRLAGLTAVQHSTEVVLDNLNFKLEAKLRSKEENSFVDGRMPTDQELSAALDNSQSDKSFKISKRDMDEVRRLMAMAELEEPGEGSGSDEYQNEINVDEGPEQEFEYEEAVASPTRRLHSSYSSHEDEDAPEMGGMSGEEDGEEYDDDVRDEDSESFHDAYEDEEEEEYVMERPHMHRPPPPAQLPPEVTSASRDVHSRDAYALSRAAEDELDEQWDYQSDSEIVPHQDHVQPDVPVQTAKRSFVNLGVPRAPSSMVPPPPPPITVHMQHGGPYSSPSIVTERKTIFYSGNGDDAVDDFAEGGYSAKIDNSTVSSVYSNDIMDFLSPEKKRPTQSRFMRGFVGEGGDTEEEDADELIVVEGGSSSKESSLNSYRSSGGPRPFEVQSYTTGSPSRSLIDGPGLDNGPPVLSGSSGLSAYRSPQRNGGSQGSSAGNTMEGLGGSGHSPARSAGQVHRVVLELDDLEL